MVSRFVGVSFQKLVVQKEGAGIKAGGEGTGESHAGLHHYLHRSSSSVPTFPFDPMFQQQTGMHLTGRESPHAGWGTTTLSSHRDDRFQVPGI